MKQFIFIVLIMLLAGCSEIFDCGTDYHNEYSDYDPDYGIEDEEIFNLINTIKNPIALKNRISMHIAHIIEYKYDKNDNWQTPAESQCLKTGDCEDKALYYAYFMNKYTNIKPKLWRIYNLDNHSNHIIAVHDNIYYGINYYIDENNNLIFDDEYTNEYGKLLIKDIYDYGTSLYYAKYIK